MTDEKKVIDVKPQGTAIIPNDQDDFVLLDKEDEQHILAELAGRNLDKFVFQTKDGPRLTYTGINWACREYAKRGECFRPIGKPEIIVDPRDPEYLIATVVVGRYQVGENGSERLLDSEIGAKRKWINQELKDGKGSIPDPFHVEKALSMAYRNGKRKLMDSEFVNQLIATALKIQDGRKTGKKTESKEKPAQPAAAAAAAAKPAAAPTMSTEAKALVAAFTAVLPEANHKAAWLKLTGLASTKEAPADLIRCLTQALQSCAGKAPVNRLDAFSDGEYRIVRIGDGSVLFPVAKPAAGEPF